MGSETCCRPPAFASTVSGSVPSVLAPTTTPSLRVNLNLHRKKAAQISFRMIRIAKGLNCSRFFANTIACNSSGAQYFARSKEHIDTTEGGEERDRLLHLPFIWRIKSSRSFTLSFSRCCSSSIFCLLMAASALLTSCLEGFAAPLPSFLGMVVGTVRTDP